MAIPMCHMQMLRDRENDPREETAGTVPYSTTLHFLYLNSIRSIPTAPFLRSWRQPVHTHTLVRDVQYRSLSVISECLLPRLWRTLGADNLPRSNDRLCERWADARGPSLGSFALARVSSCHGLPWVLPTNVEFCPRNMTPRDHGGGRRHAFYSDLVSAAFPLSVSGNFPQVFTLTDHLWEPCELFQCVSSSTRRLREVQILVDAMWPLPPQSFQREWDHPVAWWDPNCLIFDVCVGDFLGEESLPCNRFDANTSLSIWYKKNYEF